ncbi:MAG: metallopeptidase family protein [Chloroflexi bacterium]|nr:metallopeptidase family protein [Chloroflexota bacterium]
MRRSAFQRLVRRALRSLPPTIAERLENVAILVQDWPDAEQMREGKSDDLYGLLGLYQGIPLVERMGYGMVLPDRITIFRRPIEALGLGPEEMVEEIRRTVLHEVAHHLGFAEADLERLGYE